MTNSYGEQQRSLHDQFDSREAEPSSSLVPGGGLHSAPPSTSSWQRSSPLGSPTETPSADHFQTDAQPPHHTPGWHDRHPIRRRVVPRSSRVAKRDAPGERCGGAITRTYRVVRHRTARPSA